MAKKGKKTMKIMPKVYQRSYSMSAVTNDGINWEIDSEIDGQKEHMRLNNSQILGLLSQPASSIPMKKLLQTQLHNSNMVSRIGMPMIESGCNMIETKTPMIIMSRTPILSNRDAKKSKNKTLKKRAKRSKN